jgi:hypothetical protein
MVSMGFDERAELRKASLALCRKLQRSQAYRAGPSR